jgi:hypothetical protein
MHKDVWINRSLLLVLVAAVVGFLVVCGAEREEEQTRDAGGDCLVADTTVINTNEPPETAGKAIAPCKPAGYAESAARTDTSGEAAIFIGERHPRENNISEVSKKLGQTQKSAWQH